MAEQQIVARTPNALKHGVFARTLFIFKNDPEEFEELYQSLLEEWEPEGPSEEDCIFTLATLYFRKLRLPLLLQCQRLKSKKQPADPIVSELLDIKTVAYSGFRKTGEANFRPEMDPLMQRVSDLLGYSQSLAHYGMFSSRPPNRNNYYIEIDNFLPQDCHYLRANVRPEDFKNDGEFFAAVKKTIVDVLLPAARKELREKVGHTDDDLLATIDAVSTEEIVSELALLDKIDHMIERQMAKMGRIRAMKRMGFGSTGKANRSTSRVIDHESGSQPALAQHA